MWCLTCGALKEGNDEWQIPVRQKNADDLDDTIPTGENKKDTNNQ